MPDKSKLFNDIFSNIKELVINTEERLANVIVRNESGYREFMKKLIIEGLIKLWEPIVYVRYIF